jgi:hypothetical protein
MLAREPRLAGGTSRLAPRALPLDVAHHVLF